MVTAGALNVRSGPGAHFGVVTAVFRGTNLILLGRNGSGSWVQVQTPSGATGWVNANYIFGNVPVSNLPIGY